jgi:Putative transposase of IS4/5 family (DUF4096)
MAVAPWLVSDALWQRVEPLLPKRKRRLRYPGRKRLPDRQALQGILFVLHTGIAWRHLPLELGFGSGSTCYRRLDEWSPAARPNTAPASAASAGLSSVPLPGYKSSSDCSYATTAATRSTRHSSRSAAASSASGGFRTHCDSISKNEAAKTAHATVRAHEGPSGRLPPLCRTQSDPCPECSGIEREPAGPLAGLISGAQRVGS